MMNNIICPVSDKRVNESVVRMTALFVVLLSAVFLIIPNPYIPVYLVIDFYIRAFSKLKFSPLSWTASKMVNTFKLQTNMIDKAPKIFAARIGLLFSISMSLLMLFSLVNVAIVVASVLILFAFLECGVNFCAGCWVYTYIVLPLYKEK